METQWKVFAFENGYKMLSSDGLVCKTHPLTSWGDLIPWVNDSQKDGLPSSCLMCHFFLSPFESGQCWEQHTSAGMGGWTRGTATSASLIMYMTRCFQRKWKKPEALLSFQNFCSSFPAFTAVTVLVFLLSSYGVLSSSGWIHEILAWLQIS